MSWKTRQNSEGTSRERDDNTAKEQAYRDDRTVKRLAEKEVSNTKLKLAELAIAKQKEETDARLKLVDKEAKLKQKAEEAKSKQDLEEDWNSKMPRTKEVKS